MKLEFDVQHHLLHVYTKFQTEIPKHVEKSPENFEKSKTRKNNRQNNIFFSKNGTYVEKYTTGYMCIKFKEFVLIYEAMIAKMGLTYFWL